MSDPTPARPTVKYGSVEHLFLLINQAGDTGVSDFHVVPGRGIWRDGKSGFTHSSQEGEVFREEHILNWLEEAGKGGAKRFEPLGDRGHTSVSFDTGRYRVRASFRRTTDGVTVTFRLIPFVIPSVDDLDIPESVRALMYRPQGLILVEGATGSGKTTTLAALKELINETLDKHIYTIEDPIEFVHAGKGSTLFTQREIGEHATDFPSAVENALRSKPHIIMVGELLNPATAKAALHAATTGHLVMTTAHAGSVTEAIDSFIGQFPADEQPQIRSRLSQSLLGVVCQRLVPRIGGGMVAAREVLITDINFQEIIGNPSSSHMLHSQLESTRGSQTLEQSLADLVRSGLITTETARAYARKPADVDRLLPQPEPERGGKRR